MGVARDVEVVRPKSGLDSFVQFVECHIGGDAEETVDFGHTGVLEVDLQEIIWPLRRR